MAKDIRIEFKPEGFQQILQSGAVKQMVDQQAASIAARTGGMAHANSYTANMRFGPRPAASVWTHARTPEEAQYARHRLEGAV